MPNTTMAKVPVTMRALIQRINRKLAADTDEGNWLGKRLRKSRGWGALSNLGEFYVLDCSRNIVVGSHINPEEFGRELEVLADWESVA